MQKIDLYECEFCEKRYVDLLKYNKHSCKYVKRHLISDTPEFNSAFFLYKRWRKINKTSSPIYKKNFILSKYFISFIKFAEMYKKLSIPDIKFFMLKMKERSISPNFWHMNDTYEFYINLYDTEKTPLQIVKTSIETIFELSNIFDCKPNQVLFNLSATEIINLVNARKLSPWLLLFTKTFFMFMANKLSPHERILVSTVIDVNFWKDKFKNNAPVITKIKNAVKELDL